jgi:large subunit ribosomal protein L10
MDDSELENASDPVAGIRRGLRLDECSRAKSRFFVALSAASRFGNAMPLFRNEREHIVMPNAQKELIVSTLRDLAQSSKGAILTDYRGLTVAEVSKLRRKLRESNAEYHIVKNTLFKRALGGELSPELEQLLKGPTAIVFAKGDVVAPAKAILDFIRETRKPEVTVKGGYFDGKVVSLQQVQAISKLPPREEIMGQLVGCLNGPASGLVGTFNSIISELVRTIQAIADQQAEAPAAA